MKKNLNICVVSLLYGENYEAADDLVSGYAVANLRKHNFPCEMLEICCSTVEEDFNYILAKQFDMVMWAIPTTSNIPEIVEYSSLIKKKRPETLILLMGWGHHSAPIKAKEIIQNLKCIDIIVKNEGEQTVVELADRISKGEDLKSCKGIFLRDGERVIETESRPLLEELDLLPFPARDINYRHNYQAVRISSARGCLGSCTFCPMSIKSSPVWRGRSPENVVAEIKEIIKNLHIRNFMFVDPTFEDPGEKGKRRIAKIAELIIKENLNITFIINVRAEDWKEKDEDLLKMLFQAGLESITVGIESGSRKNLDLYNKRANLEDVARFVAMTKKYNIYLIYGFIMFNPYTTLEDLEENNEFLHKLGLSFLMGAYYIRLKAFPGTPLYERMREDGYVIPKETDQYTLYDYKYENSEVKKLAEKMQEVESLTDNNKDVNYYEIQKLTTFVSRIQRQIELHSIEEAKDLCEKLSESVCQLKQNLNELNYKWFQDAVNWVRESGSDAEFKDNLEKHLKSLKAEMDNTKMQQMLYGKKIIRILLKHKIRI